jgi:hypothetical protein
MKRAFAPFLLLLPALLAWPAEKTATEEIDALLTAWHHAAAVADETVYFGTLAPGAVFIGTDATERWTKEEFEKWAMPHFQGGSAWVFAACERHIYLSADGGSAWFDELLDSKSYWPCRGSGALQKMNGKWRIVHYVLSLTIPNSVAKEIKPIVEKALAGSGK